MPRATIDLGFLASLLTGTPTATANPLYGAEQEQPYTDPETGQTSGTPAYTDKSGQETPGSLPKNADTTNYFNKPSKWQELVKPEQSQYIDRLNSEFVARPALAQLDDATKIAIASGHIAKLPSAYQIPGLNTEQQALVGGGSFQTPVEMKSQLTAGGDINAGVPATQTQTDILQAQKNLAATKGDIGRQPVVEAALDQSSVNQLAQLLHVDAPSIQLQAQHLQGELGRQPTYEEVRERMIHNELNEAKNIVPTEQAGRLNTAELEKQLSGGRLSLSDYLMGTQRNQAIGQLAESQNIPVQPVFGNHINTDSTISPITRNPLGMSDIAMKMRTMNDLTSGGASTTTLPSGVTVGVRPRAPQPIDPLAEAGMGQQATVHTPEATINTGARSASQQPNDSSFPPESSGSVKARLTSDMVDVQSQLEDHDLKTRAQMYPNSQYGQKYKELQQRLEELKKQLNETTPTASTSGGRMPMYNGFSFPSSLQ